MFAEVFLRHFEGEDVNRDVVLSVLQGSFDEQVDFFDIVVGHGVTAHGEAIAVDHQVRACAPE